MLKLNQGQTIVLEGVAWGRTEKIFGIGWQKFFRSGWQNSLWWGGKNSLGKWHGKIFGGGVVRIFLGEVAK